MDLRTHDFPTIPGHALLERPLASLPAAQAAGFVAALLAPGQRFARAFHHHFRVVLGQPQGLATASTLQALASAGQALLGGLGYPRVHTLGCVVGPSGLPQVGMAAGSFRPVALYALRELQQTPWAAGGGPFALAHSIGLLDEHAHIDVVKAVLLSIANRALSRGQKQLFLLCADPCLRDVLGHFGVDFRAELPAPDALHRVGRFDLTSLDNLERVYQLAYALGRSAELEAA